ncbi:histone deacetylase complex subunit SAP130 isoform X1 [Rhinatrema bivittatum]|uniref:histone deacetylase complex subunit SAP130 isoform X1 n=1 Tax=Rhinatrema bivittatum TaxID=194408 RepID=UPI001125DD0E|nr:histone deacetylase complex subunit SAP130 isoform X1 [Rhinatrema bivittatum]
MCTGVRMRTLPVLPMPTDRQHPVEMSSQQFPRSGVPISGLGSAQPQITSAGPAGGLISSVAALTGDEASREPEINAREHLGLGPSLQCRDEKQEPVVVRPYPQAQMLTPHHTVQPGAPVTVTAQPAHLAPAVPLSFPEGLMKPPLKPTMPSRPIAPAPPSSLSAVPKVPGQVTVTMESSLPQSSAIPVATISGQQGHPSNLHHIMAANVQMSIIRSSTPGPPLHIGASHLPRGAAAAAVMSSSKVTTVLRPASAQLPSAAAAQPVAQHIIHQPIQSRPPVTTSTTVPPAVVATVSATRAQSPVITTTGAHAVEPGLSRPTLSIQQHPPPAAISIQRPSQPRDTATRITLPSHPALGSQKQQLHPMTQKTIFSTGTPVAAATVAPILATNTIPSATTTGSASHTQAPTSTIVTMTMPSHSSHATAVTTSNIPVAKVVPQQISHTSPRIQSDYAAERSNLIPISGHRASPNPVAMESRNDNRQPVPVQFQYFLPTYPPSAYPLAAHTYTPITSSVSTIRQYPAQAPNSTITAQTGVGVASTVHLNPMQLMTVDASHARHIQGIQPAPISTQSIQPGPISTSGIQPASVGTQGLHPATPINTQGLQPPSLSSQQAQTETKTSAVVLADGATIVANPISSTFSTAPAATTVVQTHNQSASSSAPAQGSSPRPSILRKKPTTDGLSVRKSLIPPQLPDAASPRLDSTMRSASGSPRPAGAKPKTEIHVSMATSVGMSVEATSNQNNEQPSMVVQPCSQPPVPMASIIATASPPSQPATALSAVTATSTNAAATIASMATPTAQPAASGTLSAVVGPTLPEVKIKEEVEPLDVSRPVSAVPPLAPNAISSSLALLANNLSMSGSELPPGASPRKKPRKQQHVISTEEGDMMEANSTDDEKSSSMKALVVKAEKRKSPPKEYIDEEGVRYVPVRPRPPITLLRQYRNPWKAAYHHFQRYSDVRVKEEKKVTLQEIANQKGISCRAQGWKTHLCAAQLLQLTNLEHDVFERLTSLQEGIIPKKKAATDDDLHRINELIQGNMQRCKLVIDQISEARDSMLKVLDHKDRVLKLLNKNGTIKKVSKLKRKEKA